MAESEKSQKDVAAAINRTARQVSNLTRDGVFVRVPSAENPNELVYPWPETLERWLKHQATQQTGAQRRSKSTDREKEARAREAETDAEIKQFKLEQLRGEWVRRDSSELLLRSILSAIVGVMELAPGKHGPRLPGDAPTSEKVAAVRAIMREIRTEMRRAGGDAVAQLVSDAPATSETAA